jgi:hypothetical protein
MGDGGPGLHREGDGYYYDVEGVQYHRSGEDAMVSKAIDYVTADTPPRSPTPPELHLLYECRTPPHKGQDEVPTQSSQAAAPAPYVAIQ